MNPYPDELSRTLRAEAGLASEIFEDHGEVKRVLETAMS
jgi:hypothetical protein